MIDKVGGFAENKDIAQELRKEIINPALTKGEKVTLDFENVDGTTQSFIHALISDPIRNMGPEVLDNLIFKNCNSTVQKIVEIVVDYMQESS